MTGTNIRARTLPTAVPELNIPVARALSFRGNHSETALTAAGKLPASPIPSDALAIPKPVTDLAAA